jgi:hypothetical protein
MSQASSQTSSQASDPAPTNGTHVSEAVVTRHLWVDTEIYNLTYGRIYVAEFSDNLSSSRNRLRVIVSLSIDKKEFVVFKIVNNEPIAATDIQGDSRRHLLEKAIKQAKTDGHM